MAEIPHVNYNGASRVIIRLCEAVNALTDGGGGGANIDIDDALSGVSENPVQNQAITTALNALLSQISAIQETIGVVPGLTASVENNVLILTGTGAKVRENRLILVSDGVFASGDTLTFETG